MAVDNLEPTLHEIANSLTFFFPELTLVSGLIIILLVGLIVKGSNVTVLFISVLTVLISLWCLFEQIGIEPRHTLFSGMITITGGSVIWRLIFDLALLISLIISIKRKEKWLYMEFNVFLLAITLGAHLLCMSSNLLMVYLSIEMMSIGAYILTTYSLGKFSFESGVKYLLFGGIASAVMLYGMSLIYTFTGALNFTDAVFLENLLKIDVLPLLVAGVFVIAGFLFKISAVPLHIWTPDVYTTAPTSAVAFFSVVPKLAGFAVLIKWILVINLSGMGEIPWAKVLGIIAATTLTLGNLAALRQSNLKRLLSYSSIAHSGFLLLALSAFSEFAAQSLVFYAVVYLLMNMGAFAYIQFFERNGMTEVDHLKGLANKRPFLTVMLVILLVSLTGLPPTAGFTAKLFVFTAMWDAHLSHGESWYIILLVLGVINVVISLFYYLKIPYFMIFKEAEYSSEISSQPYLENFLGAVLVVVLFILFFKPDWLMNIINSVNFAI